MAAEGDDSVLCGSRGLITCAQFVVLQTQLNKKARESGREREEARVREKDREWQSTHFCALSLSRSRSLSLSFALCLPLSVCYRSVKRAKVNWKLESNHQNPVLLSMEQMSLTLVTSLLLFFCQKTEWKRRMWVVRPFSSASSSWSWSKSMTQHFVVMHKRHVHVQFWRRAKQRKRKNGYGLATLAQLVNVS